MQQRKLQSTLQSLQYFSDSRKQGWLVNNSMSKDGSLPPKSGQPGSRRTESLFHLLALTCLISACGGGSSNPPPPPLTYTVGGTVTGLSAGDSLVLQQNGGGNTTVTANGNFTLATALTSGATFKVTVLTPPSSVGSNVAGLRRPPRRSHHASSAAHCDSSRTTRRSL